MVLLENRTLKQTTRIGRIIWDTTLPYLSPLSRKIEGYPQKTRSKVRLWRARAGHVGHIASVVWAQGTPELTIPSFHFGEITTPQEIPHILLLGGTIGALLGTLYIDFAKKDSWDSWSSVSKLKPRKRIRERIHKFYPFIPQ